MVMQRFGRAARMIGLKGTAIFFVEEKFVGERSLPKTSQTPSRRRRSLQKSSEISSSQTPAQIGDRRCSLTVSDTDKSEDGGARAGKIRFEATDDGSIQAIPDIDAESRPTRTIDDTRMRAKLPDLMYEFCNRTDGCLRALILVHYLEPPKRRRAVPCCSNCNEDLATSLAERKPERSQRKRKKDPRNSAIISKLIGLWCQRWVERTFPNAVFQPDPRIFISDSDGDEISDKAGEINDIEGLEKYLPQWQWGEEALLAF